MAQEAGVNTKFYKWPACMFVLSYFPQKPIGSQGEQSLEHADPKDRM